MILLFVIFGNSASGGPFARPLLPGLWRTIGGVLPPGASVDLARSALFFDGARIVGPILVLVGWAVFGAGLVIRWAAESSSPSRSRQRPRRERRYERDQRDGRMTLEVAVVRFNGQGTAVQRYARARDLLDAIGEGAADTLRRVLAEDEVAAIEAALSTAPRTDGGG